VNATAHPPPTFSHCVRVEDSTHAGEARRLAVSLCRDLGFAEPRTGRVALVVTELATNLLKHTAGAGGDLVFRSVEEAGATGLDILSLDRGPGIANIGASLRDGCSTSASSGTGLGAIRRQSSAFDIFSSPGRGTAVFSRIWRGEPPEFPRTPSVGAVCLPVHGEEAYGDAWAMRAAGDATLFMLADGLGHGPDAAAASKLAVAIFEKQVSRRPSELVDLIHAGLRSTRGAAVVVVELALGMRVVRFAGLGNISGLILSAGTSRSMVSYNGTAGVEARRIQEFTYPWPEGGLLVLHSDGVGTHWSLEEYPGLAQKDPALIAGVLFRDHQRSRDDSTVVVAKERPMVADRGVRIAE
jgi:anti-sigma regulatory factor (Ser/Thr protein kinase)